MAADVAPTYGSTLSHGCDGGGGASLLHLAFCSCSLQWLPDGLQAPLDVPASLADFRARRRASFCRSVCSLRLPLPPPRTPRGGPDHLPSMAHSFQTMGLVLREMRQRSRTAPPDVVSGNYGRGRCFRTGVWIIPSLDLNGSRPALEDRKKQQPTQAIWLASELWHARLGLHSPEHIEHLTLQCGRPSHRE